VRRPLNPSRGSAGVRVRVCACVAHGYCVRECGVRECANVVCASVACAQREWRPGRVVRAARVQIPTMPHAQRKGQAYGVPVRPSAPSLSAGFVLGPVHGRCIGSPARLARATACTLRAQHPGVAASTGLVSGRQHVHCALVLVLHLSRSSVLVRASCDLWCAIRRRARAPIGA